ncbi:MAG TPA: ATP-binding protein, partial [Bryobacteraceae bacterium]|nr:ATP-binding protein [Bryobacteraceae bacterium]
AIALNPPGAAGTAELAAAYRELDSFTHSISHDLRAPLRAIDGFSRILLEDHGPELTSEALRCVEIVRNNAIEMSVLIDSLLLLSRLGRQPMEKGPVDVKMLVVQALEELPGAQAGRRIEFVIGELPACDADPKLLRQVVENLLSNALKYTRCRAQARIEIGASTSPRDGTVYFVRDNGAGFDMRYADKLFVVFQRLHSAKDYEGRGVGLAIVRRIVARHGGRVWAEAALDQGATFYFSLPAVSRLPVREIVPETASMSKGAPL